MNPNWSSVSTKRSSQLWLCAIACVLCVAGSPGAAGAQEADEALALRLVALPADTSVTLGDRSPGQTPAAPDPADKTQNPGQAVEKTRGFFSTLVHNLADDVKHIPRQNSVYWLAGGSALALAVHPADKKINRRLVGSQGWDHFFIPGKYIGSTEVQFGAGILTYTIGRARGADRARHLGMDLMEAQLLSDGIVEGLKVLARRPRPLNSDGTPNSAKTFSFPSGHAAVTFASATVLQQHLGWKAAVPTYLVASYVAISRLHDNRHYLSDVVFGAATGIIVGRSVTWHGRNNYPIAPLVGPDFLGLAVAWR
jgi:membrane-associated phospholipid phosphatase